MQTSEILVLVVVALVLLGGLLALGLGHRRWNIGTVVAGFLVLLSAATFLYLAARVADRDRAWSKKVADYQIRIAKASDDQVPDAEGRLVPRGGGDAGDGPDSLPRLRARCDRWRRGLDRVNTWKGRVWQNASFQPPKDDTATGRVDLPAGVNAEDSPPIGVGSHVFLFDTAALEAGGGYVGEFLVQATSYDPESKRHSLTVVQTAPRDTYDDKVLAQRHDSVTVFEDLPVDRWLAFYRSRKGEADEHDAGVMPEADKEDAGTVRQLLENSPAVGALIEDFLETFRQHEEPVPKEEWPAAEEEAAKDPGTLWAEVTFTKLHTFAPGGVAAEAEAAAEGGPRRDYAAGDRAEFDLQTAVELRDAEEAVTIDRVFRRRPLTDALTLLHGSKVPGAEGDAADGTTTLLRLLKNELAALDRANLRLRAAKDAATGNTADERKVAGELEEDLKHWRVDAERAGALAEAFQVEVDRTGRDLKATEAAIVALGRELTDVMTRLAREIDRVAPPPERRAARP